MTLTKKTRYKKPKWAVEQIRRADGRIEDVCEHGVGHPNADYLKELKEAGKLTWQGIHGCCSCCMSVPVAGFEGKYLINRDGKIINSKTGRELKPHIKGKEGNQYLWVQLRTPRGGHIYKAIHRLLAETYISNPLNKRTVNHKDGDKLNNTVHNLEWATDSENISHSYRTGLRDPAGNSKNLPQQKYTSQLMSQVSDMMSKGATYAEVAMALGVHRETIGRWVRRAGRHT